jgi:rRNA-processing protein FCF1
MLLEEQVFARHVGKRVLLDSNLLLVLLAGKLDSRLFGSFKRISTYSLEDYELLERLLRRFSILITTPHILAEVSNLANSLSEQWREDWLRSMAALLSCHNCKPLIDECWTPAKQLVVNPEFLAFGLTDAALAQLSNQALIVTDDFRLSGILRQRKVSILNFRDLRKMQGLLAAQN